ncbi:hypothetical protein [Corallococcus sp. EGB]|nr:hypothetical protein [Corallococcus sp. EGB]
MAPWVWLVPARFEAALENEAVHAVHGIQDGDARDIAAYLYSLR